MELHRFFRYAIEKMCKEKKSLNHFIVTERPIEKIKDKPFLTITETAIYLGVTRPTIYGYLNEAI